MARTIPTVEGEPSKIITVTQNSRLLTYVGLRMIRVISWLFLIVGS